MPFPFFPGGLALALAVLGGALALFGLALKALDWGIDSTRRTALPGIVSGIRDWQRSGAREDQLEPAVRPSTQVDDLPVEEPAGPLGQLERVDAEAPQGHRHS